MKSRRPYLVRALYEWIIENDATPYLLIHTDTEGVNVPREFINDGRIVLNIAQGAVRDLVMDNEIICFSARFAGEPRAVSIPVRAVLAIYAKENGQGMFFDGVDEEPLSTPSKMAQRQKPAKPVLRLVK